MTKYSTGSSGGDDPDPNDESASCAMCGATENLTTGEIAGTKSVVCRSCGGDNNTNDRNETTSTTKEDDVTEYSGTSEEDENSGTGGYTITNPDSSWVEKDRPDYGNARTPYLASEYGDKVKQAIDSNDTTVEETAETTGLNKDTVRAVIDGNAVSAGVGADALAAIEKYLDIEIIDSV